MADLKNIGRFLGMNLYVETDDEKRVKLAETTLTTLIIREDTNVDKEIARMKMEIVSVPKK